MRRVLVTVLALVFAACASCASNPTTNLATPPTRIGSAGGTLMSDDGLLSILIPPGALFHEFGFTVTTIPSTAPDTLVTPFYDVEPKAGFLRRIELRISLEKSSDRSGALIASGDENGVTALFGAEIIQGDDGTPITRAFDDRIAPDDYAAARAHTTPVGARAGWDLPPGAGHAFTVNMLTIAPRSVGLDLNGDCNPTTGEGCIDNALAPLGALANDWIRQSLLSGDAYDLIELAGLTEPFRGTAPATLKIYPARQRDDPPFPAAAFQVPPGRTTCCEYVLEPIALASGAFQARWRASASIARGRLTTDSQSTFELNLSIGVPSFPLRLERARLEAGLSPTLQRIDSALIGGVVPLRSLAESTLPASPPGQDLLEEVVLGLGVQPDMDLDGDGLESLHDMSGRGAIDTCLDGDGTPVPPVDPSDPRSCLLSPKMADGFSIALSLAAVPAKIEGVAVPSLDQSRITIYPPIDGVVYARLDRAALHIGAERLWVAGDGASRTIASPDSDGSIPFSLTAAAGEVLEIGQFRRDAPSFSIATDVLGVPAGFGKNRAPLTADPARIAYHSALGGEGSVVAGEQGAAGAKLLVCAAAPHASGCAVARADGSFVIGLATGAETPASVTVQVRALDGSVSAPLAVPRS